MTSNPDTKLWRCAQACWARVRPAKDQAAHAASAASATEDLLASVAVTDVKELARRQTAYVADRRAEGISESFARVRGSCALPKDAGRGPCTVMLDEIRVGA